MEPSLVKNPPTHLEFTENTSGASSAHPQPNPSAPQFTTPISPPLTDPTQVEPQHVHVFTESTVSHTHVTATNSEILSSSNQPHDYHVWYLSWRIRRKTVKFLNSFWKILALARWEYIGTKLE